MQLALWIGRLLAQRLSPQELMTLLSEIWPLVWQRVPAGQRVDFLKDAAENHLGMFLAGLNRQERAELMNAILPIAAREFPLAEMDFLSAFAEPGDRYQPEDAK